MSSVCYYIIDKHKLTRWLDKGDSVRRNVDINKPTLIIEIILPLRITTTDNPNSGEKSGVLGKKPTNIRERAGILKENQQASTRKPVYSGTAIRHRREDHSSWNTKQASRGRPQLREYQTSIEGKTTAQGIPNRHWGEAWVLGENQQASDKRSNESSENTVKHCREFQNPSWKHRKASPSPLGKSTSILPSNLGTNYI